MGQRGGVLDFQLGQNLGNQIPAGGVVISLFAIEEKHGAQLREGGAGRGRVGNGDLAIGVNIKVGQFFPGGGNSGLVDQVGVGDEDHGQRGLTDPVILGIVEARRNQVDGAGLVGLEVFLIGSQRIGAAAPEHVGNGSRGLSGDLRNQVGSTVGDDFNLHVGIGGFKLGNAVVQRVGVMRGVDGKGAGIILRSLVIGMGGDAKRQNHRERKDKC